MSAGTVIIGASHAGVTCAAALRDAGYGEPVTLISEEDVLPYHRPPLSKGYMTAAVDYENLCLKSESFYKEEDVSLLRGVGATAIDPAGKAVLLADGSTVAYDHLVIATGSRPRPWSGAELPEHVYALRTVQDADRIAKVAATTSGAVVVIGGGYVGLELAATLRVHFKKDVHVVEAGPRLLMRAASVALSTLVADMHSVSGTHLHLGHGVSIIEQNNGVVSGVVLANGVVIPAGMVIMGIGIVPNQELAKAAGLMCDDGILVDHALRTSDPSVFAIGDCSRFPFGHAGKTMRLECVQNAMDQARSVASAITGKSQPYTSVPWFWSDQLGTKFQTVGLIQSGMVCAVREAPENGKGAFFHFHADGKLGAVETVNAPALHMLARRLMAAGVNPTPMQVRDAQFDLRNLLKAL